MLHYSNKWHESIVKTVCISSSSQHHHRKCTDKLWFGVKTTKEKTVKSGNEEEMKRNEICLLSQSVEMTVEPNTNDIAMGELICRRSRHQMGHQHSLNLKYSLEE
jgi:hypothetical protein